MPYEKTIWHDGDLVTAEKLNKIENQLASIAPDIEDEIIQEKIDNWLNDHSESIATVLPNSITKNEFTNALQLETINDYIKPELYGAIGDGIADDTNALNSAINAAQTENKPLLLIGVYKITSPIVVSGAIKIERSRKGHIIYDGEQNPLIYAITFQPADGATAVMIDVNLYIKNVSIKPYGAGGVNVKNSLHSTIRICSCNFSVGFRLFGDGHDCDYNLVYPEFIQDNKIGILVDTGETGYVNQNTFVGGSVRISSNTYKKLNEGDNFYDLYLSTGRTSSDHPANNNTFLAVSFENVASNDLRSTNNIYVRGAYNMLLNCRYEGITNVTVSGVGSMVIGGSQLDATINKTNTSIIDGDTAFIPLRRDPLTLRQTTTAEAKALSILSPANAEVAYIMANGNASLRNIAVTSLSFPSSASTQPRPEICFGSLYPDEANFARTGNGVGTLYIVNQAYGTANQRIWFKKASASNSWANVLCTHSSNTRPTEHLMDGYMMFDTTLGKPIWYYNGNWVDATGQIV